MNFHVGLMFDELEAVEQIMLTLQDANERDPDLKGRLNLVANKAKPGHPEVDARMAASPIFGTTPRHTYGHYGCQALYRDRPAGGRTARRKSRDRARLRVPGPPGQYVR
jgi:hypothetical protein